MSRVEGGQDEVEGITVARMQDVRVSGLGGGGWKVSGWY